MTSNIVATAVPSGGLITLTITSAGTMTLSRAIYTGGSPGAYTQLYSGPWIPFYVDCGDGLPEPLDPTVSYVYQLVDTNGTLVTAPVQATQTLLVQLDPLTTILIRAIEGAVNALVLPSGIKLATVYQAMPVNGLPPLPMIAVNRNILQQEQIPIGQSAWAPDQDGNIVINAQASRAYQISILSYNGLERDFYSDALFGVLTCFVGSVLQPTGTDVSHKIQVSANQVVDPNQGKSPGFYYADFMFDFTGNLNITISTSYGYIEQIILTVVSPDGVTTVVDAPVT